MTTKLRVVAAMPAKSETTPIEAKSRRSSCTRRSSAAATNVTRSSGGISHVMRDILKNTDEEGNPAVDQQSFLVANVKDSEHHYDKQIQYIESIVQQNEKLRKQLNEEAEALMAKVLDYESIQPLLHKDAFNLMMDDFDKTLRIVQEAKEMERVLCDFRKMKKAVKSYNGGETKLIEDHKKLQSEHNHIMSKFRGMYRLSKEDRRALGLVKEALGELQKHVAKCERIIEEYKEKERDTTKEMKQLKDSEFFKDEEIKTFKNQINDLQTQLDSVTNYMDSDMLPPVIRDKLREMELQQQALQEQYEELQQKNTGLQSEKSELNNAIQEHRKELESKKAELTREEVTKKHVTKERDELNWKCSEQDKEIKSKDLTIAKLMREVDEERSKSSAINNLAQQTQKQNMQLIDELNGVKMAKEKQDADLQSLNAIVTHEREAFKEKEKELGTQKHFNLILNKGKRDLEKKLEEANDRIKQFSQRNDVLRKERDSYIKDLAFIQTQVQQEKDKVKQVRHEGAATQKKLEDQMKLNQDIREKITELEREKKQTNDELQRISEEKKRKDIEIFRIEKQRDHMKDEVKDNMKQIDALKIELDQKDMQVSELNSKKCQVEKKMQGTMKMFIAMRDDRDFYRHSAFQAQTDMKSKDKTIEQLTGEKERVAVVIDAKEREVDAVKEKLDKVNKEKDEILISIDKQRRKADGLQSLLHASELKEVKLNRFIDKMEVYHRDRARDIDKICTERDVIGRQLIDRQQAYREEAFRNKAADCEVDRAKREAREKSATIDNLNQKLTSLSREKEIYAKKAAKVDDLAREVVILGEQLHKERMRVKDLESELENPINIHRWRNLKGQDPERYELVQKHKTFEDLLKKKSRGIADKEKQLEEKDKIISDLQVQLSKKPSDDALKEIAAYKRRIAKMNTELKVETAGRNAYKASYDKLKEETDSIKSNLKSAKLEAYELKKRHQSIVNHVNVGEFGEMSTTVASTDCRERVTRSSNNNEEKIEIAPSDLTELPVIQPKGGLYTEQKRRNLL